MVKKALFSLIVGLLTFCLIYFISTHTTFFTSMERSLLDGFYYMREPEPGWWWVENAEHG